MKTISRMTFMLLLAVPYYLAAQMGSITGTVTETGTPDPVVNAVVLATSNEETTRQEWVYTDERGHFTFVALRPGVYSIRFMSIAHHPKTFHEITVSPGEVHTLDARLDLKVILLDEVVVSASRRKEKLLEAPASLMVIQPQAIRETPVIALTEHLRTVAGVDVSQTGLLQQNVVVRGFNNVFSGTLLMLTDNRLAGVPSLRLNAPYLIAPGTDDIERVEVVRGPGSALYGPNAANGVVNFITFSPFASRGTSVSTTVGERSVVQGEFRHAGTSGESIGYKVSGLYFRGNDWEYDDPAETSARQAAIAGGADERTLLIGKRERMIERYSGEARLDLLLGGLSFVATAGVTQLGKGIELTDIGAAQGKDWRYSYLQGRMSAGDLFVQAFYNKSDAGKTYLLRSGDPIVDRSSQFVAQAQHSLVVGEIQRFVYGGDLLLTRPETGGTINGRNEGSDNIDEFGGYLQSETRLFDNHVDLVFAARIDKHNHLNDAVFSPRAGLSFKPNEYHNFRVTYNRAYNTPTTTELFLDLESDPNPFGFPSGMEIAIRASGVPQSGFNFDGTKGNRVFHSPFNPGPLPTGFASLLWPVILQSIGDTSLINIPAPMPQDVGSLMALLNAETGSFDPVADVNNIDPLRPTITETIEIGYRGVLSNRLQASIDLYSSRVTDFIGPLQIFTPNVFLNGGDVKTYVKPYLKQQYLDAGFSDPQAEAMAEAHSTAVGTGAGQIPLGTVTPKEAPVNTAILLASRNFGTVNLQGIDLWADYRLSQRVSLEATYSYVTKNFFQKLDGVADLSLNSPRSKGSAAVTYREQELGLFSKLRYRWTEGFRMNSGVYVGSVSAGSFVDVTIGVEDLGFRGLAATVSATNLLDRKHQYFVGAPEIGRMVMGRLAYRF